jgi:hypothetical protein
MHHTKRVTLIYNIKNQRNRKPHVTDMIDTKNKSHTKMLDRGTIR